MAASVAKAKQPPAGASAWSWRQALSTRVPAAETSTHFESLVRLAPWSSHKLARSVRGDSQRLRCKGQRPAGGRSECQRQRRARTVESASSSHRGAATSLLHQPAFKMPDGGGPRAATSQQGSPAAEGKDTPHATGPHRPAAEGYTSQATRGGPQPRPPGQEEMLQESIHLLYKGSDAEVHMRRPAAENPHLRRPAAARGRRHTH